MLASMAIFLAMTLSEFRKQHGWSLAEMARRIGLGPHGAKTVQRYEAGLRLPEPDVMARIISATDGQVTGQTFYDRVIARRAATVPASVD